MRRVTLAIVLLLALAACGGDNVSAPPTISGTTSTTAAATTSSAAGGPTTSAASDETTTTVSSGSCHVGSGPARFDASAGTSSTYLTSVSTSHRTLSFNVIQFLVGADATAAWHQQNPTDPDGPPNDYFIVDDSQEIRTAPVSSNSTVRLLRYAETGTGDLKPGTFSELPAYFASTRDTETGILSHNPFWLTFENGSITDICEQFVP